ncbi:hypothetical protein ACCO45_009952 [Purpureocillium lilacinum]|uniref:Uncharacterized protein n=1 Tax=Purpureocillium lilacinum TaxID=33203 RepID=A0ACC4DFL9_PURLI
MLHVTAQKGRIYSLDNPSSLFQEVVFGRETGGDMKEWFEHCKRLRIQPRFVTGYRTFIDARVSRGQHLTTDISGQDIEAQGGRQTNTDVKGEMSTPGERIYAICYRKINISSHEGKVTASLGQTNKWKPFAVMRGEPDEEYFQADLSDTEDIERCDTYEIESTKGKAIFGVPSE